MFFWEVFVTSYKAVPLLENSAILDVCRRYKDVLLPPLDEKKRALELLLDRYATLDEKKPSSFSLTVANVSATTTLRSIQRGNCAMTRGCE